MLSKQPRMSPSSTHCAVLAAQHTEAVIDGVGGRAFRSKARVEIAGGLGKQRQHKVPVSFIVGIPSGLSLPFVFGMKTRRNGCGIAAPSQRIDGLVSGRRGAPDCSVHSRRVLPASPALRPKLGSGSAVGLSPCRDGLRNTRLRPSAHIGLTCSHELSGRRRHTWIAPHSFAISSRGFCKFFRHPNWKSAFAAATPIRPLFAFSRSFAAPARQRLPQRAKQRAYERHE